MVQRYDLTEEVETGRIDVTPVPESHEGRYVSYEDYSKLEGIVFSLLAEAGEGNVSEGILRELQEMYIL